MKDFITLPIGFVKLLMEDVTMAGQKHGMTHKEVCEAMFQYMHHHEIEEEIQKKLLDLIPLWVD